MELQEIYGSIKIKDMYDSKVEIFQRLVEISFSETFRKAAIGKPEPWTHLMLAAIDELKADLKAYEQ